MSDEEVLAELRAIRDLLILQGGEKVNMLSEGLGAQHLGILSKLETGDWTLSSEVLPSVANEVGVTKEAVRQKKEHLIERQFIQQRGQGSGTEYIKTGLGLAAERSRQLAGVVNND